MLKKKKKLALYIGPCVLESKELAFTIAKELKEMFTPLMDEVSLTFKASYDKANRTSVNSFRGPGVESGLTLLREIKENFSLPLLTDFHHPEEAAFLAPHVDILQVPAFLCRQTDMILKGAAACKEFSRTLNVKKGQFLSPPETGQIVQKASQFIPKSQILLTERGTSFGYNNLIVDMASFQIMKSFGVETIYDATHSVQCPGSIGDRTGGKRDQIEVLAKAAIAAGADGIFLETHPFPERALSDASTSWPLDKVYEFIYKLLCIYKSLS